MMVRWTGEGEVVARWRSNLKTYQSRSLHQWTELDLGGQELGIGWEELDIGSLKTFLSPTNN